jgi:hypothetical protein
LLPKRPRRCTEAIASLEEICLILSSNYNISMLPAAILPGGHNNPPF